MALLSGQEPPPPSILAPADREAWQLYSTFLQPWVRDGGGMAADLARTALGIDELTRVEAVQLAGRLQLIGRVRERYLEKKAEQDREKRKAERHLEAKGRRGTPSGGGSETLD